MSLGAGALQVGGAGKVSVKEEAGIHGNPASGHLRNDYQPEGGREG